MNMITGHCRRRLTQPNMETCSNENLPDELIELILLKCDVKSVIRFKSVSKSWQSIISNPRFMETLQSKLPPENHNKFFCWIEDEDYDEEENNNRLYLVSLEQGGKFRREEVLGYPSSELVPLGYSNGLILLGKAPAEYVLWNPLTKKHITIPTFVDPESHPPDEFSNWPYNECRIKNHFFYDSATRDYKIVFVYLPCYTSSTPARIGAGLRSKIFLDTYTSQSPNSGSTDASTHFPIPKRTRTRTRTRKRKRKRKESPTLMPEMGKCTFSMCLVK